MISNESSVKLCVNNRDKCYAPNTEEQWNVMLNKVARFINKNDRSPSRQMKSNGDKVFGATMNSQRQKK